MENPVHKREKVISLKLTEKSFLEWKNLAYSLGLTPSMMAYLVCMQYLSSKSDIPVKDSDFDLI